MSAERITWIGGEHEFALNIGGLRAVQTRCDAGPQEILTRYIEGKWRIDDVYEVIRQGLIGGGMGSDEAAKMLTDLFESHPMMSFVITAQAVLAFALIPTKDDEVGKPTGEASPPESGSSQTSTETEQ